MKHGTILQNMWQPSYESYLVYQGVSGKYANVIWMINGRVEFGHKFYKSDILNDREHFPIVGFVDIQKVLKEAIERGLVQDPDWIHDEVEE